MRAGIRRKNLGKGEQCAPRNKGNEGTEVKWIGGKKLTINRQIANRMTEKGGVIWNFFI